MYSNIIQIGTEVIGKEDFINALTLYEGGYGFFDYCSEVLEAYRKIVIEDFCSCILPEGMFTPIDENSLRYNGGIGKWPEEWVARIHGKAVKVSSENVFKFVGEAYWLKREIENPLDTNIRFFIDGEPMLSAGFMSWVSGLEEGTVLFFGGVIRYHF